MKQINQIDRDQMHMMSFDMMVCEHSIVRVLDVFLDFALDSDLGFKTRNQRTGRPAFPVRTLLGIYLYGYLHKTRSSRDLEQSCHNNVDLWWLLRGQKPCYKTISNFRKDNRRAFRNLFKLYRDFCKNLQLYGKETVAIDGSKFRAQNSKKKNYNEAKIKRHLDYIESKEIEYLDSLDEEDRKQAESNPSSHQRLKELGERKLNYHQLKEQLKSSGATQISTSDPDARALPLHMNIVEVGYNIQSAVDDKHHLIVEYEVTNKKDNNALAPMAKKSKRALDIKQEQSLTVLADKGYFKGAQLKECHDHNIESIVAVKDLSDKSKPSHVSKDKFEYDKESNTYICPKGQILSHQSRYKRRKKGKVISEFDRYAIRHSLCVTCDYYDDCVSEAKKKNSQGRCIDRSTYQEAIDRNSANVKAKREVYRRRQSIVEHPFGTIKRAWGYTYTLLKTLPKVEAEFSLIFLCYNLRRTMSILGQEELKKALKRAIWLLLHLRSIIGCSMIKKSNRQCFIITEDRFWL